MTSKFQKGDDVSLGGEKGLIVNKKGNEYLVLFEDDTTQWYSESDFDSSTKVARKETMSTINKLTILAKSIVDADLKNMIKVGWLDSSLQLTDEGEEAILAHYLSANKAELGKLAESELKERRKDKDDK